MEWIRSASQSSFFGLPDQWLALAAFWLFMFVLIGAELLYPLHATRRGSSARIVTNFSLGAINAALFALLPVSTVAVAEWARRGDLGLFNYLDAPPATAFVATLFLLSFAAYWFHVLAHHVPLFWRLHQVHHRDRAIDLSTGVRHHPFEALVNASLYCIVAVLLGLDSGGVVVYSVAAGAFAIWTHTNIRLPERVDRALRLVLMTTAAHNVHHSSDRAETDSNYGDILIVWDRMFRTYNRMPQAALDRMRPGLGDEGDEGADSLLAQLRLPPVVGDRR